MEQIGLPKKLILKRNIFFMNATLNSSNYSINVLGWKGKSFFILKVG